jgi:Poly(R)-hydroxyalkanoic acid synthase subunit (PHA_synth_III_E)
MTDSPSSLYATWLNALPDAFRAMLPAEASAAGARPAASAAFEAAPLPFPADQIAGAVNMLEGLLTQLYQGYLPLLAKGNLSAEALQAMADGASDSVNRLLAAMARPLGALSGPPGMNGLAQGLQPWASMLQGLVPGLGAGASGTNPLQLGMDRAFGGLGEAFGLGPLRELEQAMREMLAASSAKQRAQLEYLAVVAQAWKTGTTGLVRELQAMGARGERVESLLGFIRLWAKAIDAPMHDAMQGAHGLEVTAKMIRASSEHRLHLQKAIGLASEALHVPTRADMDAAFREIQELKREMRRLKKALPAAAQKKLTRTQEAP